MATTDQLKLEENVLGSLPTVIYVPNFITESEQSQLLHHIYEVPASKWKSLRNRRLQNWGGVVTEKGLIPQALPSWLTKFTQRICEKTGLFPSPINHVLINEYLPDQGIMSHQDGPAYFPVVAIISLESAVVINFTPHPKMVETAHSEIEDATTHSEVKPVSTNFTKLIQPCSVLLEPCSLLIFKDAAYSDCLHGIEDSLVHSLDKVLNVEAGHETSGGAMEEHKRTEDGAGNCQSLRRSKTRVSLTCRLVLKVNRNLLRM